MSSIIRLQSLLLLALVTLALAAPAPESHGHIQKRSFKVERSLNPNYKGRTPGAGTRALIKAYRKYSVPLPPGLLDAMAAANAGQASAPAAKDKKIIDTNEKAGGLDALLGLLGLGGDDDTPAAAPAAAAPAPKPTAAAEPAAAEPAAPKKSSSSAPPAAQATTPAAEPAAAPAGEAAPKPAAPANGTAPAAGAAPAPAAPAPGAGGNATGGSQVGKIDATPLNGDVEYVSVVEIAGQKIPLDFDSGSSDLWVFSSKLPVAAQSGHALFDPTKSTTFKAVQGSSFSISYGDGSGAAGTVGTDVVNVGGATVTQQAVELATAVSQSFVEDQGSNGLLGLAFSSINTVKPAKQKTFFDNVMPSLAQPVFTADLRHNVTGAYEFGNVDAAKFVAPMKYAPINDTQGFWQFSSQKFQVAGGAVMNVAGGQAIADTGTTLMLANAPIVNAYYSQVTGAVNNQTVGGVTFPCAAVLPDMQFDVGGAYMATVRGSDINFAPVDATGQTCFGGLQAIDGLQIYGDIMFKSNFVVFNGGDKTIGMAPHAA